jgi:hypothetical protein
MKRALSRRQKGQDLVEYGIIVAVLALLAAAALTALGQAQRAYFLRLPGLVAPSPIVLPTATSTPPPTPTPTPTPPPTPTPTPIPTSTPVPGFHLSVVTMSDGSTPATGCGINTLPPVTSHTAHVNDFVNCQVNITDSTGTLVPTSGTLTWNVTLNGIPIPGAGATCDIPACGPNPIRSQEFQIGQTGNFMVTADFGGTLPPGWQVGPQGFWAIVVN